ncbi:MAG: ribosomal RNA small subunit methyltransferase A [Acidobacteria bacterium RIFCSPLOWO2_02_FULL_64_15]|nr:MAG: ribosomal RNA small subunit methyltransferase A [Acidobacteria bacterium RIFCSPLOWO2_02_FULL_64_15]
MIRKRFGQHFLEPAWVTKVVRAIEPQADECFFEIGSGRGALTGPLAARARSVVAFEIDRDLAAMLNARAPANVTVVEGDFLESRWMLDHPPATPVRVAGNLPYNVASAILFKLVDLYSGGCRLADATVMLQREVARRLVAHPGSRTYGVLTVLIGHSAEATELLSLPPGAFRPVPKVHSSLVRLRFHAPDPPVRDAACFRAIVESVFTRRRKTLANALLAYSGSRRLAPREALSRAGLNGRQRPETLTIAELASLSDVYAQAVL